MNTNTFNIQTVVSKGGMHQRCANEVIVGRAYEGVCSMRKGPWVKEVMTVHTMSRAREFRL
jgi:hypothetical protein